MGKGKRNRTKTQKTPTYNFTKADLEAYLTREMRQRVLDEGWVKVGDVEKILSDDLLRCLNAGISEVFITMMEQGILGWSRIERDIVPHLQNLDLEWSKYIDANDVETGFDMLTRRLNYTIKQHTRPLRKVGNNDKT